MTQRPAILDELGHELVRAARADEARRARPSRVRRAPRAVVIALLALLGAAAVAAAASLILGRGAPISVARPGEVPVELQPVKGTARLNGLDVPDPDGGPKWDVRTSRGKTGAICATVGQVHDGDFGLLGLDRLFRPLPPGAADSCSTRQATGATLAGVRALRGGGRLHAITVVSGVAAAGVRSAVMIAGGRTVSMRLGAEHGFVAVVRGSPEALRPRVVLTEASGKRTTLRFADSGEFTVADPADGSPWTLQHSNGRDGGRCVRAMRLYGPDSPMTVDPALEALGLPSESPKRCGREDFVAIRRFVPQVHRSSITFYWGPHPARTVVWGAARRAGGEIVLHGAGAPRRLLSDGPRGGFLAVLDGHVDPHVLRVTVDGRPLDAAKTFDAAGRPVGAEPQPAWQSVASAVRRSPAAMRYVVVPGSTAINRRATDPSGGAAWALRSWSARLRSGVRRFSTASDARRGVWFRYDRRLTCLAVGVMRGPRLVEPLAEGRTRTIGTTGANVWCTPARALAAARPPPFVRTYVDDAQAAYPRPVRVVVAGLLGDGVRSAQLLGAGAPRELALGQHGTYLVVLSGEHAGARLRLREVRANGVTRTSNSAAGDLLGRCVPAPGLAVRVSDPAGEPPWTIGRGRADGHNCRFGGRVVGGRVASVSTPDNSVVFEPSQTGVLLTRRPRRADRPVTLDIDRSLGSDDVGERDRDLSGQQLARRTLPGRSVLSGTASDRVVSVTLRTPRDVRTVRPGPGGLILVVYDGVFYDGRIHAIAHMRDGSSIRQSFPIDRRQW